MIRSIIHPDADIPRVAVEADITRVAVEADIPRVAVEADIPRVAEGQNPEGECPDTGPAIWHQSCKPLRSHSAVCSSDNTRGLERHTGVGPRDRSNNFLFFPKYRT